jgi:hypothetical protein
MGFYYYIFFCIVIFALIYPHISKEILSINCENTKVNKTDQFFLCLMVSFFPLINLLALLVIYASLYEKHREKKKILINNKLHPESTSFETLLKILNLYKNNNSVAENDIMINRLQKNIDLLRPKCNEVAYKNLLIQYEFTFARIETIINESSNLNDEAFNKVLCTSKELIDNFVDKCEGLFKKEKEIALETEETILNRLLSELNEEKTVQNR